MGGCASADTLVPGGSEVSKEASGRRSEAVANLRLGKPAKLMVAVLGFWPEPSDVIYSNPSAKAPGPGSSAVPGTAKSR